MAKQNRFALGLVGAISVFSPLHTKGGPACAAGRTRRRTRRGEWADRSAELQSFDPEAATIKQSSERLAAKIARPELSLEDLNAMLRDGLLHDTSHRSDVITCWKPSGNCGGIATPGGLNLRSHSLGGDALKNNVMAFAARSETDNAAMVVPVENAPGSRRARCE